jgi:hypothetical protein
MSSAHLPCYTFAFNNNRKGNFITSLCINYHTEFQGVAVSSVVYIVSTSHVNMVVTLFLFLLMVANWKLQKRFALASYGKIS